jgi:hypothetical protein
VVPRAGGRQISYSDFKQAVRSGQVAEVYVGEQTIRGTFKRESPDARVQHQPHRTIRSCSRSSIRRA